MASLPLLALATPETRFLFFASIAAVMSVTLLGIGAVLALRREQDRRRAEAEKLTAVGQATARILHQLKNPLQTVILHAELLEDERLAADAEMHRETREAILSESKRLADMLNELSLWASGVRRNLSLAPIALHELVWHLVRQQQRGGNGAAPRLELGRVDEAVVEADMYYLRQALENIVRNAEEALEGRSDGLIGISLERTGDSATIRIADNGPGIPPDRLETIFEPFVSSKAKGMGVGLSICRDIVEGHGGRIAIRSEPGVETVFALVLPLYAGSETSSAPLQDSAAPLR